MSRPGPSGGPPRATGRPAAAAGPASSDATGAPGQHGPDPFAAALALRAAPGLRPFNEAGILDAADVHVAQRLGALAGEDHPAVLLGAALAVRAVRLGHVRLDLGTVATTVAADGREPVRDPATLAWPEPGAWRAGLAASPLVGTGPQDTDRPLRLEGAHLYLDRYWREECQVAADLRRLADRPDAPVDEALLADGLARLVGGGGASQEAGEGAGQAAGQGGGREAAVGMGPEQRAVRLALRRGLTVIAGGPGTGKTTAIARVLALLHEQAGAAGARLHVALAAPTGKAAARVAEAVHSAAAQLDTPPPVREALRAASATTVHRLLGWRPERRTRFRHHRGNRLPADVVIVDEASMVSLTLMARLLEALPDEARLILVGDPHQLASVEAGAVLGDVVGPVLGDAAGPLGESADPAGEGRDPRRLAGSIVVLRERHRFSGAIAALATAIEQGDGEAAVAVLAGRDAGAQPPAGSAVPALAWFSDDAGGPSAAPPAVRAAAVAAGAAVVRAAAAGDAPAALDALGGLRLLCAHRHGPYGASAWAGAVGSWLREALTGYGQGWPWYVGRPLLVTGNDYSLDLFNGDTGVVVSTPDGRVRAVFQRGADLLDISPTRLGHVETVHAMTIHKSQGSQFREVVVVLPPPDSPLLTRELLYTAVTRATHRVTVVGSQASIRAAVGRPIARASGLRERLWDS